MTEPGQFTRNPYMWELNYTGDFDPSQEDFLATCMQENLNHARHIENERMSLLVGISAMVAGVLAVGGSLLSTALESAGEHNTLVFFLEILTVVLIFMVIMAVVVLAKRLNTRWNTGFDRHLYYAKSAYYMLHRSNFELNERGLSENYQKMPDNLAVNKAVSPEEACRITKEAFQEEFSIAAAGKVKTLDTMPLYCFNINRSVDSKNRVFKKSTKKYFDIFYTVLLAVMATMIAISIGVAILYFVRN